MGAALHWIGIQVEASRGLDNKWYANVTITDTFDFTENKNPFEQDSIINGILWAVNDVAYYDSKWGLLDPVEVIIKYEDIY